MLKKSKSLFLFVCFLGLMFSNLTQTNAMRDIQVVVKPRRIESRATYLITLKLDIALQVHDWIKVIWPKETKLPVLPEDPIERKAELKRIIESIFIGTSPCSACQGYPEINYKENSIRFNIHLELNPAIHGYEQINITITDRVGIINPPKPGMYELKIATAKEQSSVKSIPYEIVESRLGEPTGKPIVSVTPNGNHAQGEYRIECNVGTGGSLIFNQSRIRIQFSNETLLSKKPQDIEPYFIKVNDKPVMNKIMITEQILTFISPINSENSEKLSIVLEKGVGIINPNLPGDYVLKISTSEDPDWADSAPYVIEQNFEFLSVVPNKANRIATYKFQFLTNQKMDPLDPIIVLFPNAVFLPSFMDTASVLINQKQTKAISIKDHVVMLFLREAIPANTVLAIDFTAECMIKNPTETGMIKLGYKISEPKEYLYTSEVLIEKTILTIQSIKIDPPNASAEAEYIFQLLVDSSSGIPQNESINIVFPIGSKLPEGITGRKLLIDDQKPMEIKIVSTNEICLKIPFTLLFDKIVTITIAKDAGIINPDLGNSMVQYTVYSSLDETIKATKEIFLYPPLPKTEIIFTAGKEGNDGWFLKAPIMDFSINQKGCKTFFFWNGIETNILEFVEPKVLPDGQYQTIISYYSESPYGREEVKTVSIKVDTILPELNITKPSQKSIKTNQKDVLIAGASLAHDFSFKGENVIVFDKKLFINNKLTPITSDDGRFSINFPIEPKKNTIQVRLEDEAGNSTDQEFEVECKRQNPACIITTPINEEWILEKTLTIQGKVDPGSIVTMNEQIATVDAEGFFLLVVTLSEPGLKNLTLTVVDEYGNNGEFPLLFWYGFSVRMQINSLKAVNNNKNRVLDLAPFIKDSRTMVPFRFLGEELQAKISYEKDSVSRLVSKIQYELKGTAIILIIGDLHARVNGEEVLLDSPPLIIKGRTVVPLRFITENLGCKTIWEPNTKSIQVLYAP